MHSSLNYLLLFFCIFAPTKNPYYSMTILFKYVLERFIPLMAFIAILSNCTHNTSNMTALVRIDSLLLKNDYVEVLNKIKGIDPQKLNKADLALYSLLLTQAQYKNYEPITSDSIINYAVNYYQNSNDKEKATRSLLYQGCVYEVLGNPEKAIDCYNQADKTAGKQDIANKAYAKLRIGVLYQENIVGANSIAVEKYFEALQLYRLLSDKHYELLCLTTIGSLYRNFKEIEKQDSALFYIDSAIELAKEQNDIYFLFENIFIKAELYEILKHEYLTAKNLAVQAINIGGTEIDHPRAHFCAAKSFIKLRQIDSAYYYLNHAPKPNTARDSIMYYNLMADIAQYKNNNELWLISQNKAISMADSILINNLNAKLFSIEKKYDLQQKELKNISLRSKLKGAWLTVTLALLAALALFHFLWRYRNRLRIKENEYELLKSDLDTSLLSLEQMEVSIDNYKNELKEAEDDYKAKLAQQEVLLSDLSGEIADVKTSLQEKEQELKETETGYQKKLAQQEELVTNLTGEITDAKSALKNKEQERLELNEKIAALQAKKAQSDDIRAILDGQIKVVHELIQSSHELNSEKFVNKFKSLMSIPESPRIATYWSNLQVLTNDLYNNILEEAIRMGKGKLRESDINFIALLCCGYSRTVIMICMKFKNIVTISNKKKKIAAKMGIPSLDEFIRPYQENYKKSLK